jgi:hypothetical protein
VRFRRDRQHPGALPVGVEAHPRNIGLHAGQVVAPHPFKDLDLVGPACFSVREAMGQAGVDEAAVATRRSPPDALCVDQNDRLVRITLCGMQCRPQSCVARAHNQQVGADGTGKSIVGGPRYVEPHRAEGASRE